MAVEIRFESVLPNESQPRKEEITEWRMIKIITLFPDSAYSSIVDNLSTLAH